MFGKKAPIESLPEVNLNKIPDDFYGGKNPVVKFKTVETASEPKPAKAPILSVSEKKLLDKQTSVGAGNKLHPVNLIANSKFLFLTFLIIMVVVSIIGAGYYFWQFQKNKKTVSPIAPVVTNMQSPEEQISSEPILAVSVLPAVDVAPSLGEVPLDLPSGLLGDSANTDNDELTDPAEELFTTEPTLPDTDGDKYPDNNEIFHLYNPVGKEPMRLIDSGLVSIYTNPVFNYKLYYPKSWAVGSVDSGYKDVLFSTFTGENIEVRVLNKNSDESFVDWFARVASKESFADYTPIESVFKQSGFGRKDNLVYFFPTDNQVFAIIYHPSNSNVLNYRIVNKLFMRSFQLGSLSDIPSRIIEDNILNPDKNISTSSLVAPVVSTTP